MDNEEKMIRDLLEKGFLTKAPENFTDKVMIAVAITEKQKSPVIDLSYLSYAFIILGAFALSTGALFFTNKELLLKFYQYLVDFNVGGLSLVTGLFNNFNNVYSALPGSGLIAGIVLIMIALLAFDKFMFSGRRYVNVFV